MDCVPTQIQDHSCLKVEEFLGNPCKSRKTYCFLGLAQGQRYGVYNNSLPAIKRALLERVFYVKSGDGFIKTPKPHSEAFDALSDVLAYFKKSAQYAAPMTAFQFAGTYVGRRRTNYEAAAESLLKQPISPRDARIKAFIKAEKYNFTVKSNPAPRIIQPRDPRYIVESGRYIKPIEKQIYKKIDQMFGAPTIFKGMNAETRGRTIAAHWAAFEDPVALGLDASRFDQHVSEPALHWEHNIYKTFYPRSKYFAQLLSWQVKNFGVARCSEGVVKYRTDGCRMSGDTNTALGNCLLMSSMVYAYASSRGIVIRLANDGDDCVVFMERKDLEDFSDHLHEYFNNLGFEMTVEEPVFVLEHIEFCQCHPVFDGNNYIMVRDPRVAISKDTISIKPLDNLKTMRRWCAAVGEGGMHLTGGIPVWQDYYSYYVRVGQGSKPLTDPSMESGMQRMSKGMFRKYKEVTSEARYSFYLAFGMSPQEQYVTEHYYSALAFTTTGDIQRFVTLPIPGREDNHLPHT